jgi:transitional endoplasmic reticulum ATPase
MAAAASATTAKGADAPAPLGSPAQSKPNRLIVDEASNDDNSVVAMHPKKMELLDLYRGDTVRISSSEGRDTVCIVLADNSCDEGRVRMTQVVRNNLGVRLSDAVFVHPVRAGGRSHGAQAPAA